MRIIFFLIVALKFLEIKTDNGMEGRVVKGKRTLIERHPHSVYLFMYEHFGGHICGGSIVNQRVILTAAHCFDGCTKSGRIIANVGSEHVQRGRKFLVISVRVHPKYDSDQITNDIALAGLENPIVFGLHAKRIVIAKKKVTQGRAIVAGWGAVQEFPQLLFPDYLQEISVPFMSRKKCAKVYLKLEKGKFCGGRMRSESHPSAGDSGSPLVYRGYLQIGLVSYKNNGLSKSMIVYTDVPYYYKWIVKNVKTVFCKKEFNTLAVQRCDNDHNVECLSNNPILRFLALVTFETHWIF